MDDHRETIWGIRPEDRRWFQLLTLLGGIVGSVILALLELDARSADTPPSQTARNIALGISISFAASGFISWGLLQIKELTMPIGDWIREANEKRRRKLRQEGYNLGYDDRDAGKPRRDLENTADKPEKQRDGDPGRSE